MKYIQLPILKCVSRVITLTLLLFIFLIGLVIIEMQNTFTRSLSNPCTMIQSMFVNNELLLFVLDIAFLSRHSSLQP